jgi:hypothetical protein
VMVHKKLIEADSGDSVVVSFRAPRMLVEEVDKFASGSQRTRASFIVRTLMQAVSLDAAVADQLVRHGEGLLRAFHQEYRRNPVGAETEFQRGMVTEWRHLLDLLYGERITEELVLRARNKVKLSVPPAGPLTDDGNGYIGWDSGCDMGFIGRID